MRETKYKSTDRKVIKLLEIVKDKLDYHYFITYSEKDNHGHCYSVGTQCYQRCQICNCKFTKDQVMNNEQPFLEYATKKSINKIYTCEKCKIKFELPKVSEIK
jgi:hypothetical protein